MQCRRKESRRPPGHGPVLRQIHMAQRMRRGFGIDWMDAVIFGKESMVMRQFWGYQNNKLGMQTSFEPSAFLAYPSFHRLLMQIPLPAGFLISKSP